MSTTVESPRSSSAARGSGACPPVDYGTGGASLVRTSQKAARIARRSSSPIVRTPDCSTANRSIWASMSLGIAGRPVTRLARALAGALASQARVKVAACAANGLLHRERSQCGQRHLWPGARGWLGDWPGGDWPGGDRDRHPAMNRRWCWPRPVSDRLGCHNTAAAGVEL